LTIIWQPVLKATNERFWSVVSRADAQELISFFQ
jgi:hypothetical protein